MLRPVESPPNDLALFHDYFAIRGGGERLVLTLAKAFGAALTFGYRTHETYDATMFPPVIHDLALASAWRGTGIRAISLALLFRGQVTAATKYPIRIFSGAAAVFAAPPRTAAARNIYYCHTPPRFLYDQRDYLVARLNPVQRAVAGPVLTQLERAYRRSVGQMDVIVTNSATTRQRLRDYLGLDSVVVHPPVDIDQFRWLGQQDHYVSTARLSALKRVDQIIAAFRALPDRRLVVVSGGEERAALERLAAGASNIEFRGWVDDAELKLIVGSAIASIYVPRQEDFGMSPVESMAAGKPVIGVNEGGLRETIVDGVTGTLLPPDFDVGQLRDAIAAMTPARALEMRAASEARAASFSRQHFLEAMGRVIETARAEIAAATGR